MSRSPISPDLFSVALDRVSGDDFELFVRDFLAAILGAGFVPLGGIHDGGADGFVAENLSEDAKQEDSFLQTSITTAVESKIRQTVKRLRKFGRNPKQLMYVSALRIANSDMIENALGIELEVLIRIRDCNYLAAHLNDSFGTAAAYTNHLEAHTRFLLNVGASRLIAPSEHVATPDVFVYLRQEVERRRGNPSFADAVVDALAVWALEGTDPDANKFMGRAEIRSRICSALPAAEQLCKDSLDSRLEHIAGKTNADGRLIRWHRKRDVFALPFETRQLVAGENAEDERVRLDAATCIKERVASLTSSETEDPIVERATRATMRAVELTFEAEGLRFAQYVTANDPSLPAPYLSDSIERALADLNEPVATRSVATDLILDVLRECFYKSTEAERLYFGKLARTYSILFSLQADARVIRYFEDMAGDFYLYVGSDLLVRALSERYLAPEDQMTRNMLHIAAEAGATLVLAEPVLGEVVSHLRATDHEFRNHVQQAEPHISLEMARESSRILIRAYLYTKFASALDKPPKSWDAFINQFCEVGRLHQADGVVMIRRYLQATFSLDFVTRDELQGIANWQDVAALAEDLLNVKSDPRLADNDALMVYAVYGKRRASGEDSDVSEFGYRTWWLTGGEHAVLAKTRDIVRGHRGAQYLMRPEFLLNFIALSPSAADARATYASVMPSLLGVHLARRMGEDSFRSLMDDVADTEELEPGRRLAAIATLSDRLKSDRDRRYRREFKG